MSRIPPLLPGEVLRRVLRVARFNGTSVLTVAAIFGLAAAMAHDQVDTVIGVLVAGTGALELHGLGLLRHGQDRGVGWLVGSQLALLAVILGYVLLRLGHVDVAPMRPFLTADQLRVIAQSGLTTDEFLRMIYRLTYAVVGAVSVLYQGGLAFYYLRRRGPVGRALNEPAD